MELNSGDWLLLLKGLSMTLMITAWTLLISLPLGIVLGVLRYLKIPILSNAIGILIEAIRAIPLVLYLVIVFLVLPMDAEIRAVLTLSTFNAMYIAEIVRGGLQSIDPKELQAARVLGLSLFQRIWHIALPQALRRMIPSLVNQISVVIKDTTLVSIGLLELTKAIQILNTRHFSITVEFMLLIAATYFILCYSVCLLGQYLERRLAVGPLYVRSA